MRYFLVDDDDFIRTIISDIIEEENLGTVVGEANDGSKINDALLQFHRVDVIIIDLLMPERDGLETVLAIKPQFDGKIIMLSQVETKELIGEAYTYGIDQFVTKPVNKNEIINVLKKLNERILLERSIQSIQSSLNFLAKPEQIKKSIILEEHEKETQFLSDCKYCLNELGIACENGYKDMLEILHLIYLYQQDHHEKMPTLKDLYYQISSKRFSNEEQILKETKSTEQRIRRAILQSLEHIANIGLTDFSHPTFEKYVPQLFDIAQVQAKMFEIKGKPLPSNEHNKINVRKYLLGILMEIQTKE